MRQIARLGCSLVLVVAGCGGGETFDAPACAANEIAIEGTIDGEPVSFRGATDGYVWINFPNADDNAYMDIFGSGIAGTPIAHMEWGRTIAGDETTEAFGWIDLSSQSPGSLNVGNCETGGFVSVITARPEGADFLLRDLREAPFCEGASLEGELAGCVRFESNFW